VLKCPKDTSALVPKCPYSVSLKPDRKTARPQPDRNDNCACGQLAVWTWPDRKTARLQADLAGQQWPGILRPMIN